MVKQTEHNVKEVYMGKAALLTSENKSLKATNKSLISKNKGLMKKNKELLAKIKKQDALILKNQKIENKFNKKMSCLTNKINNLNEYITTTKDIFKEVPPKPRSKKSSSSYYIFKAYDKGNHTSDANYEYGFSSFKKAMSRARQLKHYSLSDGTPMQHLAIFEEGEAGSDWSWSNNDD